MKKLKSLRWRIAAVVLSVFPAMAGALCYFNFSGCASSSCGWHCTVVRTGPVAYSCYTSMTQCCQCASWVQYCNCTFGTGVGVGVNYNVINNATCVSSVGLCAVNPVGTGSGTG